MKKLILLSLAVIGFTLFAAQRANAQNPVPNIKVTIHVQDEAGESIPGVAIVIKGTYNGAASDMDGNATLHNCPANATLVISHIGFNTIEIAVNGREHLTLVMTEAVYVIDPIIVIYP